MSPQQQYNDAERAQSTYGCDLATASWPAGGAHKPKKLAV